jgi:ABC-type transport system involved in cytochrome c biogenesis permease subunit
MLMPVWAIILLIALVGWSFWFGLKLLLDRIYDNKPIVCDMCGKLVFKTQTDKCPSCSQSF